jgi:hypothetical protein
VLKINISVLKINQREQLFNSKKLFIFSAVRKFAKQPDYMLGLLANTTPRVKNKLYVVLRETNFRLDVYDFKLLNDSHPQLYDFVEITHIEKFITNGKPRINFLRFFLLKRNKSIQRGKMIYFESSPPNRKFLHIKCFHEWVKWAANHKHPEIYCAKLEIGVVNELNLSETPPIRIKYEYAQRKWPFLLPRYS